MEIEHIHPDLRPSVRALPRLYFERGWQLFLMRVLLWIAGRSRAVPGVTVQNLKLGRCRVRIYRPTGAASGGALLWLHSGGFVMGMPRMDDHRCSLFCRELGAVVVSVYYSLAPRRPFPAGLDDSAAAWQWLLDSADELGVDRSRIAVAGESSGAGLAASPTQRLRDEGATAPVGQLLLHPMLDHRTALRKDVGDNDHLVWNNRNNRTAWSLYLGHEVGARDVAPYASPATTEDLSNLPPAWIGVAGLDLFREENTDYARRLREAGVPCTEEIAESAFHGFSTIVAGVPISDAFSAAQLEFLRGVLAPR